MPVLALVTLIPRLNAMLLELAMSGFLWRSNYLTSARLVAPVCRTMSIPACALPVAESERGLKEATESVIQGHDSAIARQNLGETGSLHCVTQTSVALSRREFW